MNLSQARLISAIHFLLGGDERLIHSIFSHQTPNLLGDPREILQSTAGFSHGERLLVQAALDLWNGTGRLRWEDAVDIWDSEILFRFLQSILLVRELEADFLEHLLRDGLDP